MNENKEGHAKEKTEVAVPRLGIFSIANQIRYGLLLLVVLSLLITAGVLIYLSFQAQLQRLEVLQQERSRAAAGEINAYVDDLQRKLSYLARVQGLTDLDAEAQQNMLEGLVRHNSAYEAVAILDDEGRVVSSASLYGQEISGNLADSPLFLRTFKQHEDFVGPVELDPTSGLPAITLAVPIRDRQDEVAGVLLARVNLQFLWFIVSQTEVGETGYTYIIDNRNFLVAETGSSPETFSMKDVSDQPFIRDLTSGVVDTLTSYRGLRGTEVLGAISPIRSVRWNVVVELPTIEAFAPLQDMLIVMGVTLAATTAIAIGLGIFFSRQIVSPLQRLTEASTQISAGNMDTQVDISSRNEMGVLAVAFNEMAAQLQGLYATLEQQVADRTRRLEIVATLSERLSAILDLEELLAEVVNQIKDSFGYYHAHIYLLDDKREKLVVAEGTGQAGAEMKAKGHSIPLDAPTSLVARAARAGEIVRVDNVREAEDWLPNPLLPDTYSEMAVPITLEGQVVGVLDVQQDKIGGLDEGDASLLRSLANQVATAIRNARLFNEVETALAEAHAAQERYLEQSWEKAKIVSRGGQYHYARVDAPALDDQILARAKALALTQDHPTIITVTGNGSDRQPDQKDPAQTQNLEDAQLDVKPKIENRKSKISKMPDRVENRKSIVAPITLQDKTIGSLQIHPAGDEQTWTEDDLDVVEAVVDQLAQTAENLRLFDETRERASREQTIREITDKLRAAPNMERLAAIATEELSRRLSATHAKLDLEVWAQHADVNDELPNQGASRGEQNGS